MSPPASCLTAPSAVIPTFAEMTASGVPLAARPDARRADRQTDSRAR